MQPTGPNKQSSITRRSEMARMRGMPRSKRGHSAHTRMGLSRGNPLAGGGNFRRGGGGGRGRRRGGY